MYHFLAMRSLVNAPSTQSVLEIARTVGLDRSKRAVARCDMGRDEAPLSLCLC